MSRTRVRVAGAWVDVGVMGPPGDPGSPGPTGRVLIPGHVPGLLVAGVGAARFYNDTGSPLTIQNVRVSVTDAPTGNLAKFDINLNGTTIFTTQANRPTIPIGSLTSGVCVPDVTVWPAGAYLTVDVDQIGSVYPGQNATIQIGAE